MQVLYLILLLFYFSIAYGQPLTVKVRAQSAILYNPETGAILYQKRAYEPHYPASTIKIATALLVLEKKGEQLEDLIEASSGALQVIHADIKQANFQTIPSHIIEHDGVKVGLKKGEKYSIRSLLHALILVSGNDAANVLAEGVSGSISNFVEEMNRFLQKKGITGTSFQNPHGLLHPAQISCAYDLAQIASFAFENPIFRTIAMTKSYPLENGKILKNTSRFLKEGKFYYSKYIGGKTGYIANAGYNLVAGAEHQGRRLILVLLGCKNVEERYEDAIQLFEAAFQEKKVDRLLFPKTHECFVRRNSKGKEICRATIKEDVVISYYPSEEPKLQAKIVWHATKKKLIIPDEIVGELIVENERGKRICSAPIFAIPFPKSFPRKNIIVSSLLCIPLIAFFYQGFKKNSKFFQR